MQCDNLSPRIPKLPKHLLIKLLISKCAKLIFNDILLENLVLSVLFVVVSCCIWQFFELCVAVHYSCHLYQCQLQPFFSFAQYSPDVGVIVFHKLSPLLMLLLAPILFLFLFCKADCLANMILSSWIWLVRARILTSFSGFFVPLSVLD